MKKTLVLMLVSLGIAGCATTLVGRADYDKAQNFSSYHRFAWIDDEPLIGPAGKGNDVSPLNRKRITQAIEAELARKGFQKVAERSTADFVIAYTVGARDRIDAKSYPVSYRVAWRWGWPYFGDRVDVRTYREGTLAIDIFDGATRAPVWHGWASKEITPHDIRHAAEQIPKAVAAILKNFPPR